MYSTNAWKTSHCTDFVRTFAVQDSWNTMKYFYLLLLMHQTLYCRVV